MTEIEIGSNLVGIISLIINAILIPLLLRTHKCIKEVEKKVG
jgi:hypothetical protein